MHLTVKIMCTLFLIEVMIQSAVSFPQFSFPFVSFNNKNKEEPPRFNMNVKILNPFSSIFAKNSNSRPYEITSGNNEFVNNEEKIITVTPHASYIANKNKYEEQSEIKQTTQGSKKAYVEQNYGFKDLQKANQNVEKYNFNKDDINKIFEDLDVTTESTTEYESTTEDLLGLNRSGMSGHVIATLLG